MMDMNVVKFIYKVVWWYFISSGTLQYEIVLNHFNYIEPLIMLCEPYDIAEYFHPYA